MDPRPSTPTTRFNTFNGSSWILRIKPIRVVGMLILPQTCGRIPRVHKSGLAIGSSIKIPSYCPSSKYNNSSGNPIKPTTKKKKRKVPVGSIDCCNGTPWSNCTSPRKEDFGRSVTPSPHPWTLPIPRLRNVLGRE